MDLPNSMAFHTKTVLQLFLAREAYLYFLQEKYAP